MAMDPTVKAKWIAALESEQYEQGRGVLRGRWGGHCCLGVLCDVSGLGQWESDEAKDIRYTVPGVPYPQYAYANLAGELRIRLGLTPSQCDTLVDMNDLRKKTFPEIAQWIRENL